MVDSFTGDGIIPAYAGSTDIPDRRRAARPDHPRIRGEHSGFPGRCRPAVGSSPHTRGAPSVRVPVATWVRIIPAYAGSTGFLAVVHSPRADHPRIRGEHNTHTLIGASNPGSSPHTRGAQVGGRPGIPVKGIIPAYAGSTRV